MLGWKDKDYVIPADQVMMAIGIVEDVITYAEMISAAQTGRWPLQKISRAYGELLRFAGARVSDEEIYEGLFLGGALRDKIVASVNTLMVMMTPPSALAEIPAKGREPKSGNFGRVKTARSSLSKRSIGRSSAITG